jgi:ribosomal protein L29
VSEPEFTDDADRLFYEEMRAMSDEDLLTQMRELYKGLMADEGLHARQLGLTDEYLNEIRAGITRLEEAMEKDRQASALLDAAKQRLEDAAAQLREAEFLNGDGH